MTLVSTWWSRGLSPIWTRTPGKVNEVVLSQFGWRITIFLPALGQDDRELRREFVSIYWANIAFGEHLLTARGVIMTDLAGSMGKLLAMWMDRDPQSRRSSIETYLAPDVEFRSSFGQARPKFPLVWSGLVG